jgi:methylmalonyl-CoA/ethylmalonyl-CoA epimerase
MCKATDCNFFGDEARFEHIAIAVRSIDDFPGNLQKIADPVNKVNVAFANINGVKTELVEPLDDTSPVIEVLERRQALYHVCYSVTNIQGAIETARKHGFHAITKPVPAIAFDKRNIIWLFSKTLGLVELVERAS